MFPLDRVLSNYSRLYISIWNWLFLFLKQYPSLILALIKYLLKNNLKILEFFKRQESNFSSSLFLPSIIKSLHQRFIFDVPSLKNNLEEYHLTIFIINKYYAILIPSFLLKMNRVYALKDPDHWKGLIELNKINHFIVIVIEISSNHW